MKLLSYPIKSRFLRVVTLFMSVLLAGTILPQISNIKLVSADDGGYSWVGASPTGSQYTWGYNPCPSNDTGCKAMSDNGYGIADPWVYGLRNCTSFVAWKINQVFGVNNISGWGNAATWNVGYTNPQTYPVYSPSNYTPQVGDIAQWGAEKAEGLGHVAYVYAVNNGVASLDEYNVAGTGLFTSNRTTGSGAQNAGTPDHYIHIGTVSSGGSGGGGNSGWNGVGNATYFGQAYIPVGQTLQSNAYITSPNAQFALVMQSDGNLVEYHGGSALWATGTGGNPGAYAIVQYDGNFVVYTSSGSPLWGSGTNGQNTSSVYMEDDGNLIAWGPNGNILWTSNTGGWPTYNYLGTDHLNTGQSLTSGNYIRSWDNRYVLLMQTDGNMVLYGPGYHGLWSTQTGGKPGAGLAMQTDGNIVVWYNNAPVWASNTAGLGTANMYMQTDGNLVAYNGNGTGVWGSGTNGKI